MSHRLPLADYQFIADFAAFARSKGDETYNYMSNTNCACCQFLRETGRAANPWVGGFGWSEIECCEANSLPEDIRGKLHCGEWTFSALADRLEALLIDAPAVHAEQPC